jgi:hypothetical protein
MPELIEKSIMIPSHSSNNVQFQIKALEEDFNELLNNFKRDKNAQMVDISTDDLQV